MLENILNFIKINENIATAGQPSEEEFQQIGASDFEVVVNLALHNSDNALENEDKVVSKNGMVYIHIPVSWEEPEKKRLEFFIEVLQTLEKQKKKVFIHCAKNYRVSVFMYHYKKRVWRENIKPIFPKDFTPNQTWEKFLELD